MLACFWKVFEALMGLLQRPSGPWSCVDPAMSLHVVAQPLPAVQIERGRSVTRCQLASSQSISSAVYAAQLDRSSASAVPWRSQSRLRQRCAPCPRSARRSRSVHLPAPRARFCSPHPLFADQVVRRDAAVLELIARCRWRAARSFLRVWCCSPISAPAFTRPKSNERHCQPRARVHTR